MHGILSITKLAVEETKKVNFVGFVEAFSLTAPQGRLRELGDNFLHIFSEEYRIGFLLASQQSRICFVSHKNCGGRVCFCKEFAEQYLYHQESRPGSSHMADLLASQPVPTPLLAVLADELSTKVVTHYSRADLAVDEIPNGCYSIR